MMVRLDRASLRGGLIVSVQAPEGSPMREPEVIAAMAEASLNNGAIGVRLESPEHIWCGATPLSRGVDCGPLETHVFR